MELFFTLEKINEAAQQFWKAMEHARVFAFHGQLGAGKTTFIAALCHALGAIDQLSSPTFSIINEYRLRGSEEHYLYHLDL